MSATKRGSLADFASVKSSPAEPEGKPVEVAAPPKAKTDLPDNRKALTVRLTPAAWKQLKLLALEREQTAHTLLIESVNDLFEKHGKKPIA